VSANICWRVSATFTGAPTAFAASAAATGTARGTNFDPNPPPMCSATTRSRSGGMPNSGARILEVVNGP
jgi:hypothetical protein